MHRSNVLSGSVDLSCLGRLIVRQREGDLRWETMWEDVNHWAEVTIGLLGPAGKMKALTPTVIAHLPPVELEVQEPKPATAATDAEPDEAESLGFDSETGDSPAGEPLLCCPAGLADCCLEAEEESELWNLPSDTVTWGPCIVTSAGGPSVQGVCCRGLG